MRRFIFTLSITILIIGCNTSKQDTSTVFVDSNYQNVPKNLFAEKNDSLLSTLLNISPAKYCDINHNHFVDIVVKKRIDSLRKRGIKDILFYRDWIGTNGFNGYGKLIWKQNDNYLQYQYNFENYNGRYGISSIEKSESRTDEAFEFYIKNRIDTVLSRPKEHKLIMPHDSDHFVYTSINENENCFNISGLNLIADSLHLKVQLVNKLNIPSNEYFDMIDELKKINKNKRN